MQDIFMWHSNSSIIFNLSLYKVLILQSQKITFHIRKVKRD